MATRKQGDGSRGMDDGSDRPGSYAKSMGSRRKRKGKKGRSSIPPAGVDASDRLSDAPLDSVEQAIDALDVEGEEVERHAAGRVTKPDWGELGSELGANDNSVDDLRRKPSSSRALARRPVGPLGMEDAQQREPSAPPHLSTPAPSPSGRMKVVEINATEPGREPRESLEPGPHPFGDPFADEPMGSEPPKSEHVPSVAPVVARPSRERLSRERLMREQAAAEDAWREAESAQRPSMSSVFGARASIRPSPPPPVASSVSILWWVVVCALTAIIIAAGVIALRESNKQDVARAPETPTPAIDEPAPAEPAPTDVAVKPIETPEPSAPVPAAIEAAKPTTPASVTPVSKPASVAAAPTPSKPVVAAKPMPVAPKPVAKPPAPAPETAQLPSSAVPNSGVATPSDWNAPPAGESAEAPSAPAPEGPSPVQVLRLGAKVKPQASAQLRPREPHPPQVTGIAEEPAPTAPPPPAAEPATQEERLPQNPYK